MSQQEIEQIFELLGLSSRPGPALPRRAPDSDSPPGYQRVVFIAAESTSQVNEPEVNAELERDPQRDQRGW